MINLNEKIEWSQVAPQTEGVYYVLGQGLTGVQQRYMSKKGFVLKDGEMPLVYGTLKDLGVFKSVYVTESKISKEDLKKLHYEADSAYELHADEDVFALVLVKGNTRHVVWLKPNEVLKNNVVEDFYDIAMTAEAVYGYGGEAAAKPEPKKEEPKAPAPKAKPEPKKEEPKQVEVVPVKEETPAQESAPASVQEPVQEPVEAEEVDSDDIVNVDDLPF